MTRVGPNSNLLSKLKECDDVVKEAGLRLDDVIGSLDEEVALYPHSMDIRYTHDSIPVLPSGNGRPFVHVRALKSKLLVHVDKDVDDSKDLTRPRRAARRFQKQFSVGGPIEIDEYMIGLVRQSLGIFLRVWRPAN